MRPRLPGMSEHTIPLDPPGEDLHFMRMSGTFYCRCKFAAPWGLTLPPFRDSLMFHVVTSGRCWLEVEGAEHRLLQSGDLALVPHGEGHRLTSETGVSGDNLFDLPREAVSERYEILRLGNREASARLVCGVVRFDHPTASHLINTLPRMITVGAATSPWMEWVQSTVRLIAAEARELRPGGETVITWLADVLVIQAIRSWIEADPVARTGWLGALRDPLLGPVIALIHREPARAWTVGDLASEVAMSRSAFAARFSEFVAEPPMHYVARWRMHVVLASLKEERATLGELAIRLGYQSEVAFSRAFKRFMGCRRGQSSGPAR